MSIGTPPWYVYALVDPRDKQIFYVGLSHTPWNRRLNHKNDSASAAYPRCQDILAAGLDFELRTLGTYHDYTLARRAERHEIISHEGLLNRDQQPPTDHYLDGPHDHPLEDGGLATGKTLLDWFAGQALAGLLSNFPKEFSDDLFVEGENCPKTLASASTVGWIAYYYADAMLEARRYRERTKAAKIHKIAEAKREGKDNG